LEKLHGETQAATELKGHKQSIDLVCFSPDGRYFLSVSNHDGSLFLWEGAETVARNRLTKVLNRAFFDSNGDLVTLGRGYFKVWAFRKGEAVRRKEEDCWMLEGRVLNFGKKFAGK
jgi:WD40 repeat protein